MSYQHPLILGLLLVTALLTACGTIATPAAPSNPTQGPVTLAPAVIAQATANAAESASEADETAELPTEAPTVVPPTTTEAPPTEAPTAAQPTETTLPPTETPAMLGDPANGDTLFHNGRGAAPACVTCHMVEQDMVLIGPSLVGIAGYAAERVDDQSAEDYLHDSILVPNAFIVPDTDTNIFSAGGTSLMFQQYGDYLTEEDVNDLVAYLLTLE